MNLFIGFMYNLALLFSLLLIYTTLYSYIEEKRKLFKILNGISIGTIGVFVMLNPVMVNQGIFLDMRTILLAVSGIIFSSTSLLTASVIMITARLFMGGIGTFAGVLAIIVSSFLGFFWKKFRSSSFFSNKKYSLPEIFFFGVILQCFMIMTMFALGSVSTTVIKTMAPYMLSIHPFATILLYKILYTQVSRLNQEKLHSETNRLFKKYIEESPYGVIKVSDDGKIIEANKKASEITEYGNNLIGMNISDILGENDGRKNNILNELLSLEKAEFTIDVLTGNDVYKTIHFKKIDTKDVGIIFFLSDITSQIHHLNEIEYISFHDYLTGLYNRRFFKEELKRIDTFRNLPITIIMADINNLKIFNDTFGHDIGDKCIIRTAEIFKNICREDEIIARTGGDEFIFLLPETDTDTAQNIVERINKSLAEETVNNLHLSVSFGISAKISPNQDFEEIIKTAENKMYKNKIVSKTKIEETLVSEMMSILFKKCYRESYHSRKVSDLCYKLGKALHMNENELNDLETAALIHDIGKVALDELILTKDEDFSEMDFDEMTTHSEKGYRILNIIEGLAITAEAVLYHHERWDGNGYPKGLKEEKIPLFARIISLADAYDAMINEHSYKEKMTKEDAIEEIKKCSGTQFDPELAKLFIEKVLEEK